MRTHELNATIETSLAGVKKILANLNERELNTIPFAGSWTAGQVVQHIFLSASGFVEMINGPARETHRPPDQFEATLKKDFLDFGRKMVSPEFVTPPTTWYHKEQLLKSMNDLETSIPGSTKQDLTPTCTLFELPVLGWLTRYEALCFICYHTQRHLHQLQVISAKLEELKQSSHANA